MPDIGSEPKTISPEMLADLPGSEKPLSQKPGLQQLQQPARIDQHSRVEFEKGMPLAPALTLALIGENFGGRDHSTVIHALESVEDMMKTDANFKNSVDELTKKLKMRMSL